jgi:predicted enzyme related to lactoylglutathione lyase
MQRPYTHGVGGVLSADIAVPDHERELGFYSKVLATGDDPLWRDDLTNNRGTPIIGLGARSPEYDALPLQWMPHFQVADVAASSARALELGGKELMHDAKGKDGQSQWAVLVDHVGAAFGIIPVVAAEPNVADSNERVGCISWLTLAVPDASTSRDFYQQVVGWSAKSIELDDEDEHLAKFDMQRDNGISSAEILTARGEHEGLPPVWLITLPVGDLKESLRHVRESGGEVVKDVTAAGRAVIRDPVGVYIALEACW